jgi:hypothetical protein
MSELQEKEFASALKWIAIIICATIAYNCFISHPYYFINDHRFFRGNTRTGSIECLKNNAWIDLDES